MRVSAKGKHGALEYILVGGLFTIMWYIAGWSTDNWDWIPYENYFNYNGDISIANTLDIGFVLLNKYLGSLGISFLQFRQIIYFVFLLFVLIFIIRYSYRPVLTTLIYFVVLFFRDIIITRNSMALIFITIAVLCYLSTTLKYRKLLFVLFWLLSCTFHLSFLLYGVILLSDTRFGFKTYLATSLFLAVIGSTVLSNIIGMEYFLGLEKLQNKVEGYLSTGSYVSLIISSVTIIYNYWVVSLFEKYNHSYNVINVQLFKKLNGTLSLILIFTSVNMEFMRLYYNFFLIDFIVLLNIKCINKTPISGKLFFLWWVLWSFLWMVPLSGVGPQVGLIINSIK